MANSLTIQLRPTRKYSPPTIANLFHNAGLSKANYWIKNPDSLISDLDLKNLTTRQAVNLWREWEEKATELVIKNKGKNPQKKQVLIEEGLLVIGKDVLEKDPKVFIKIFEEFKEWFEKKYNTKILAYFFHNHEGHIDLNSGEFNTNLHIHFLFLNVDRFGNSVRRQIKKSDLSLFQDKIFEIGKKYIPNLERATNYKELGLKAPKHLSHREFRTEKNKQMQLKLAPELQTIKKENKKLKEENKELLAKVKDLKELNKQIREQFKELGAKREDYARLEQLVKELKAKIKVKELTIKEMEEAFNKQLEELKEKDKQIKELQEENKKLKDELNELIEIENLNSYNDVKTKLEELKDINEEKLRLAGKIRYRNFIIMDFMYLEFKNTDFGKENIKYENKIEEYKRLNDKYSTPPKLADIQEYKDKIYLLKILEKRIEFLIKKLKELNKKIETLAKQAIEKIEKDDKKRADLLINKFFEEQEEQKDYSEQINQTQSYGPKL